MLLRFRVANHRSLLEEQELSFVAPPRRGEPRDQRSPIPRTVPVVGIYGANASGKSNVLDALRWMCWAITNSHTTWKPDGGVPRQPFLLLPEARELTSFYELDFVHDGVRYSYGFEVDDEQVRGEWLHSFPHGPPRRLFTRDGPQSFAFGRALTGETARIARLTRGNALYLSAAASNNHPLLGSLYKTLTQKLIFAASDFHDEHSRLKWVKKLLDNTDVSKDIGAFLRLADLGVEAIEVGTREFTPEIEKQVRRIGEILGEFSIDDKEIYLRRAHTDVLLSLQEESAGTRAWLAISVPTFLALFNGCTLVVDEIDSSLHPMLSSTLIRMFKDPVVNATGAQLLFASHDTTFLGSMLEESLLDRGEVWFTEKDERGATTLFPLADFHPRKDENVERGYFQGRYGAVPYVNFEKIREIFRERQRERDDASA